MHSIKKNLFFIPLIFIILIFAIHHSRRYLHHHVISPDVTVAGFIQMADGLGRQSVELIDSLKEKFDVHFQKTRPTNWQDTPPYLRSLIQDQSRPLGKVVIFEEALSSPGPLVSKIFNKKKPNQVWLAYSMFETSKIPNAFVDNIQNHFDAVIVPDPYLIEVYKNSGVTKPIFFLPLGLDLNPFINAPLKSKKNTPFVFANFSSCEGRKNHLMMIRAFHQAFGDRDDVLLKINARRGSKEEIAAVLKEIKQLNLHNVTLTINPVDNPTYLKNFLAIDCYVSLSKGEGFSIQPREAMALGIPVIVSDNTAQSTICKSGLAKVVPSPIEEKAVYECFAQEDYGNFFNVHLEDAAKAMLDMFNHYDNYLNRSMEAREWVKQYQYSQLQPIYNTVVKPKRLILGNENLLTDNLLMTTSTELYQKYLKIHPQLKK